MITLLVKERIELFGFRPHIILQLSKRPYGIAGGFFKPLYGFAENIFGRALEELAVISCVPEVYHLYSFRFNKPYNIVRGELIRRFPEKLYQFVAAHKYVIIHYLLFFDSGQM